MKGCVLSKKMSRIYLKLSYILSSFLPFFFFFSIKLSWVWMKDLTPIIHLRDLGLQGECPALGVFKGILARIHVSFEENLGKLRKARSTIATGD